MRFSRYISIACCIFYFTARSFACFCAGPADAKSMRKIAAWEADNAKGAIFEGRVETQEIESGSLGAPISAYSMTTSGKHRIVKIHATRVYRGPHQEYFTIFTGLAGEDCGFDFEEGKEYLVFANSAEGKLFTDICSGTAPVKLAGYAIRFLRGEPPSGEDLLDYDGYYGKISPQLTGTVCGHVKDEEGRPLKDADVKLWQLRDEKLPPNTADDPDLTKPDGSFCIRGIFPGKYLLTAESGDYDYENWTRLMGFYPGVRKHAEAVPIEITAGMNLPDVQFKLFRESLYSVTLRVVTPDGSPPPWKNLSVAINSSDHDGLAYNISHGVNKDSSYRFGFIPAGHYTVSAFLVPDYQTGRLEQDAAKWQSVTQEVDVKGHSEIVIKLAPSK